MIHAFTATNGSASALISDSGNTLRDPSNIIEVSGTFYVWFTYVVGAAQAGYAGTIKYATAASVDGPWTIQGEAIGKGGAGTWNENGVYTPQVVADGGTYYLFTSGIEAGFSSTPFPQGGSIGGWSASAPSGPWTPVATNPIIDVGANGAWDDGLVDEAIPLVVGGQKRLYFKGRRNSDSQRNFGYATPNDGAWSSESWTKAGDNPVDGLDAIDSLVLFTHDGTLAGFADDEQRTISDTIIDYLVDEPQGFDNRRPLDTKPSWAANNTTGVGLYLPDGSQTPTRLVYHAQDASDSDLKLTMATLTVGR